MKVKIIDGCIGCGLCTSICPNIFEINDNGVSEVIKNPEKDEESAVKEASNGCPVDVIVVEE